MTDQDGDYSPTVMANILRPATSLKEELDRLDTAFAADTAALMSGRAPDRPKEIQALAEAVTARMKRNANPAGACGKPLRARPERREWSRIGDRREETEPIDHAERRVGVQDRRVP